MAGKRRFKEMSFLTHIENFFSVVEADVVAVVTKIRQGFAVAETDIANAMKWIAGEIPNVVTVIQTAESIAGTTAGLIPAIAPEVEAAIAAANVAVAGLNAFKTASGNNAGTPATLMASYVAVKQATALAHNAVATAVKAPSQTV
jgi:hypothetical protein